MAFCRSAKFDRDGVILVVFDVRIVFEKSHVFAEGTFLILHDFFHDFGVGEELVEVNFHEGDGVAITVGGVGFDDVAFDCDGAFGAHASEHLAHGTNQAGGEGVGLLVLGLLGDAGFFGILGFGHVDGEFGGAAWGEVKCDVIVWGRVVCCFGSGLSSGGLFCILGIGRVFNLGLLFGRTSVGVGVDADFVDVGKGECGFIAGSGVCFARLEGFEGDAFAHVRDAFFDVFFFPPEV